MSIFWDNKYSQKDFLYGRKPNEFFKEHLDELEPGILLLPGEGEGRNAVYAALKGWHVWAFDSSEVAVSKALGLAGMNQTSIRYDQNTVEGFHPGETGFDAIGLIYTHFLPEIRHSFFRNLQNWLNPNGKIILEGFRKDQIHRSSGGPKSLDMLYSVEELRNDFNNLYIEELKTETIELNEGPGHQGEADVIRFVATKTSGK